MKTKQNLILTVLIAFIALTLNSCKKETVHSVSKSKAGTQVSATYFELLNFILPTGDNGSFKTSDADDLADCVVITENGSMPYIKTFDYGTGCTRKNGKVLKGQVTFNITADDLLYTSGASVTISFNNFFIDNNQITGSLVLQNNGLNGNGNMSYTLNINGQKIYGDGSGVDSIFAQQDVEWVEGYSTNDDKTDDQFAIIGNIGARAATGELIAINVLDPLIKKRNKVCEYFVKGVLLIQINSEPDRYVDYGNGECDNLAVETVNGVSETVTLD